MMMMIGELNASHTGVSGGPSDAGPSTGQTRQPGFLIKSDPSGFYRVGHIFKSGPADHDYLKIAEGDYIISLDGRDLKTTDNYWQYLTLASSNKLRFMLNDKPVKDGAWEVVITPGGNFGDLQYAQAGSRIAAQMVEKLSNGEIGYLHIRAMDAPSLRQFQLDLAANRTKKALVIDQRFNGGGGIDQELLAILSGRAYQYTLGRDAGVRQPRPQNFYGPMVVMQNERSASDAEMFPAGFQALGLGKIDRRADGGRGHRDGVVHAARRLDDPHAGHGRVDGDGTEHGELRRPAGRAHRQHADRFLARAATRRSRRRSKC